MGIQHPKTIEELSKEYGSDRIMISLDSKNNKVVIKGWQEKIDKSPSELSNEFKEHGAGSILFTNVDVEGLLGGFYTEPVEELKKICRFANRVFRRNHHNRRHQKIKGK